MLYDHRDVKSLFAPLLPLVLALLTGASVRADDHSGLREALDRNEIVSFKSLLDWIERRYVGKVVEVELEDDEGRLVYEIDLLSPQGDLLEFVFDARSGDLLLLKGRNVDAALRK